jgi:hypothetical protein
MKLNAMNYIMLDICEKCKNEYFKNPDLFQRKLIEVDALKKFKK